MPTMRGAKHDLLDESGGRPRELQQDTTNEDLDLNRSNDDPPCASDVPANPASTVLYYEYDLTAQVSPASRAGNAPAITRENIVAGVVDMETAIPKRLWEELGRCAPIRRLSEDKKRELAYEGIFDVAKGNMNEIRTDVSCGSNCLAVRSSLEIFYDADRLPENIAKSTAKLQLQQLMSAGYIQSDECGDADCALVAAFVAEPRESSNTPQASAGSVATSSRGSTDDKSLPPYAIGIICVVVVAFLLMLWAGLTRHRRRHSEIEHEGLALDGAPEKPGDDDEATLDLEIERTGTFENEEGADDAPLAMARSRSIEATASRKPELPVLQEAVIHEDEDEI